MHTSTFIYYAKMYQIRGIFFDTSKTFDKILHKGLIFELKQNRMAGNFLNTLTHFPKEIEVVLNGQQFKWSNGFTSFDPWTTSFLNLHKRLIK